VVGSQAADGAAAMGLSFRKTFTSVYLPTTIYEAGEGAITPILPLLAIHLGANAAQAALVMALLGIGQVFGEVPAGHLAARIGDRAAMLWGAFITLIALVIVSFAPNWIILAFGTFVLGGVNDVFVLARQAYLSEITPAPRRSRALSTLGGMQRTGALIGPFLGGLAITFAGRFILHNDAEWLPAAIWLAALLVLISGIVVALVPDVDIPGRVEPVAVPARIILKNNWRMFATLGIAFILIGAIRQTRNTVLPLWSEHLGLSAAAASYIFGISGILDVALFYPGGRIMDKRGRMWVAVPSAIILGGALIALPFTRTFAAMALVALVMGLGNGLGSGMLMTIGADMAKPHGRTQFLSLCRLFSDSGTAVGPLVVAWAAASWFLGGGIFVMGVAGLAAAWILAHTLPKHTPHANRHTRIKHGLTTHGANQ
jgi:MFS family permease